MELTKKHNILIIDDSEFNIAVLLRILGSSYSVSIAKSGIEGIEIAKKLNPDVIILDIIMPGMDGFETIAVLKKNASTSKIPVIFISGLSKTEDEEKGLALGGADYITKPFSTEIVKLRVRNQILMLEYIRTIEELGRIDQLTGIPNRRSFHERLFIEWKSAIRDSALISILIMDIDNFKMINDTFGHMMGDVVLQKVSKAIKDSIKRPTDFIARWGGEEFIVLLPSTATDGAFFVAESIRKSVEDVEIIFMDGRSTKVTMSIGLNTHQPTNECVVNSFLHDADSALYEAKANGKNNVTIFNP